MPMPRAITKRGKKRTNSSKTTTSIGWMTVGLQRRGCMRAQMKGLHILGRSRTRPTPGLGSHTAWRAPHALIVKEHMLVVGHGGRQRGAAQRPLPLIPVLGAAATSKGQARFAQPRSALIESCRCSRLRSAPSQQAGAPQRACLSAIVPCPPIPALKIQGGGSVKQGCCLLALQRYMFTVLKVQGGTVMSRIGLHSTWEG